MKKDANYSKLYKAESKRTYRYNYTNATLELVYREKNVWTALDASGLSKAHFEEDPEYWVDQYDMEIGEEMGCMMDEFR